MKFFHNKYFTIFSQIILLILLTLLISYLNLDIKVQKLFYWQSASSSPWYRSESPFWQFGYHYGTLPAILLTFAALVGLILSWVKVKIKQYRKYFLLIIFTMIIGPGLIINAIFKDHWGRPRPRQIEEFNGKWEFKEVWEHGIPGKGKSFPCGHCSMGFFFITLYYSFKRKNKPIAYSSFIFSILLGIFIGFARISQGGHFLSDVLWAGGITYLTASVLYYFVLKIPEIEKQSQNVLDTKLNKLPNKSKKIIVALAIILASGIMIFTFLFSKPFYSEHSHNLELKGPANIILLNFEVDRGDINIYSGEYEPPIQIRSIIQGFGFPEYDFKSNLLHETTNDTLKAIYLLKIEGLFNEIDVVTSVFVDSTHKVQFLGSSQKGTILFNETK